jgi:ATP-dependent exoDNAse (exonuclease V) alpha subunit
VAGTGKTTALRELVAACAEVKIEPLFCAPTAAATDVLRKEGFEAVTLLSLLLTKPALSARHLVVLDEAGAVGIDDMKRLFDLARDARVILSGDTGQHASVVRGDALRILEKHSDFQSGQLTRIRRQRKAEYRKAVELAAQKRTAEAVSHLRLCRRWLTSNVDGRPANNVNFPIIRTCASLKATNPKFVHTTDPDSTPPTPIRSS